MGGDAIQEPAVAADGAGTAGEAIIEGIKGFGVAIVRRLVEEQDAGTRLQKPGQVRAVALAARRPPNLGPLASWLA